MDCAIMLDLIGFSLFLGRSKDIKKDLYLKETWWAIFHLMALS